MRIIPSSRQKTDRLRCAGFSLAEALVSVGLGAIMFMALYSGFTFCFATVRISREDLRATQIALSRLERVRVCAFNQITNASLNPPVFSDVFDPDGQSSGSGGIVYTGNYSAVIPPPGSVPESYRSNMFLVTVTVAWTSGKVQQCISNQTYVTINGIESYIARNK